MSKANSRNDAAFAFCVILEYVPRNKGLFKKSATRKNV